MVNYWTTSAWINYSRPVKLEDFLWSR